MILSPGEEIDTTHILLTQTRPWKGNHPPLPFNEQGSLRGLKNLKQKLKPTGVEQAYSEIIEEQKSEGVVETAHGSAQGVEFYLLHKPVIGEEAASTKVRIVYDAPAKAHPSAVSLNDCLYPGSPLQNKLWNVLVRSQRHLVAVVGDLKKAFLQVRIGECDRDALRFHMMPGEHSKIETLRFTRALFGLAPSLFLLGGVIEYHLDTWEECKPLAVAELCESLCR